MAKCSSLLVCVTSHLQVSPSLPPAVCSPSILISHCANRTCCCHHIQPQPCMQWGMKSLWDGWERICMTWELRAKKKGPLTKSFYKQGERDTKRAEEERACKAFEERLILFVRCREKGTTLLLSLSLSLSLSLFLVTAACVPFSLFFSLYASELVVVCAVQKRRLRACSLSLSHAMPWQGPF